MGQKESRSTSRVTILFIVALNVLVILLVGQAYAINPQPEPPAKNQGLPALQEQVEQLDENLIAAQNTIIQLKNALFMEMRISRLRAQIQAVIADLILGDAYVENPRFQAAFLDISSNILGNKMEREWINEKAFLFYHDQAPLTEDAIRNNVQAQLTELKKPFDAVDVEAGVALVTFTDEEEMASIRLQMLMERRQKIIQTLSNVMKKLSDAQDQIIQNIK